MTDATVNDLRAIQRIAGTLADETKEAGLYHLVSPLRDIAKRASRTEERLTKQEPAR